MTRVDDRPLKPVAYAWKTKITVDAGRIILHRIPWGLPDRALGRAVCASIEATMPPTPWVAPRGNGWAVSACGWCLVVIVSLTCMAIAAAVGGGAP